MKTKNENIKDRPYYYNKVVKALNSYDGEILCSKYGYLTIYNYSDRRDKEIVEILESISVYEGYGIY